MVKYEKQFYNAKNFKVFSVFSIIAHNISKKNLKYLKFVWKKQTRSQNKFSKKTFLINVFLFSRIILKQTRYFLELNSLN